MIFSARQIQEKCKEQNRPLYMAFIDLKKAFDSVNRDTLWEILKHFGCTPVFVDIIKLLHDGMKGTVFTSGKLTDSFPITAGVKQGCVLAPTLFSLFVAFVVMLVEKRLPEGVPITYRMDGKVFNLRRLQTKSKVSRLSLVELQYADDAAICAHSPDALQNIMDAFVDAYTRLGLALNVSKTEILHQPAPHVESRPWQVTVMGDPLPAVSSFRYLGSHLSSDATIDEVTSRLAAASRSFGRLLKRIFMDGTLRTDT